MIADNMPIEISEEDVRRVEEVLRGSKIIVQCGYLKEQGKLLHQIFNLLNNFEKTFANYN